MQDQEEGNKPVANMQDQEEGNKSGDPNQIHHPSELSLTTQMVSHLALLKQSCLVLKDVKSLLEASNFSCMASLALSISLSFVNALLLQLDQGLLSCIQLCLHGAAVRGQLCRILI